MQRITRLGLFSRDKPAQNPWQVIGWWEKRRIAYNVVVGAVGILSSDLCVITAVLTDQFIGEPLGLPNPPFFAIFAVILYGVMANVCYTGGWLTELLVLRLWPEEGKGFGKISFFLGLVFSVALTLVPGTLIAGLGAVALFAHAIGR